MKFMEELACKQGEGKGRIFITSTFPEPSLARCFWLGSKDIWPTCGVCDRLNGLGTRRRDSGVHIYVNSKESKRVPNPLNMAMDKEMEGHT